MSEEFALSKASKSFPNTLPGKQIVIEKVFNSRTRQVFLRSNNVNIQSGFDLFRMEQAERAQIKLKNGALQNDLLQKLPTFKSQDKIEVLISLSQPAGIVYLDKFTHTDEELKAQSTSIAYLQPAVGIKTILARYPEARLLEKSDFSAIISTTKTELLQMAQDPDIGSITDYEPTKTLNHHGLSLVLPALFGQTTVNLVTLARSAYSHSQNTIPSGLANGVHAATFENGLDPTFLACLGRTPAFYEPMTVPFVPLTFPTGIDSVHSLVTFTNLANAAPGASLYHHRSVSFSNSVDENFLIDNAVASLSISTTAGERDANGSRNSRLDDFAYRWPYPVFSNPTGNAGWSQPPHWAAYNGICVGNVQDSAQKHFKIDTITCGGGATQTRNPNPVYGNCIDGGTPPNCAGDRELPSLVAPGYTPFGIHSLPPACFMVSATYMTSSCISQPQAWGTSMSAPTVNGMVASLIGKNSYLARLPELVRAILFNTSRNVHGSLWDQNKDGKDGAGVIHGADAIAFATGLTPVNPGNTALVKGYNYNSFCESDFNGDPDKVRGFNIKIPNPKPSGKHLRIVLTWDSFPDLLNSTNELPDLDIELTSNLKTRWANSFDSNNEIIDIAASELTAGGTYTTYIHPVLWRRTAGARSSCTYSALTWGFVTSNAR